MVNSIHAYGHNFDAVVEIKKKADEKDRYLIWKINNHYFNNENGSFVFKMSTEKAEICLTNRRQFPMFYTLIDHKMTSKNVVGLQDLKLSEKLQFHPEITLPKAIKLGATKQSCEETTDPVAERFQRFHRN